MHVTYILNQVTELLPEDRSIFPTTKRIYIDLDELCSVWTAQTIKIDGAFSCFRLFWPKAHLLLGTFCPGVWLQRNHNITDISIDRKCPAISYTSATARFRRTGRRADSWNIDGRIDHSI